MRIEDTLSTARLRQAAARADGAYTLMATTPLPVKPLHRAVERLTQVARQTGAGLVYADYQLTKDGRTTAVPTIDCQRGSLRDDFDFGPVVLADTRLLRLALEGMEEDYTHAAFYALRLTLMRMAPVVHVPECLFSVGEEGESDTALRQFAYVDPRNRDRQLEMERACTAHLKAVGAWLPPLTEDTDVGQGEFPCEASVIIPVRNRVRTIGDAIRSALAQQTDFSFNVMVVDNHSTDGTTEAIRAFGDDRRLLHIVPDGTGLGIGGCWDLAVRHPQCGRFAVQLDSDDLYNSPHALATVVRAFHQERCAMVVGSYLLTDFDGNPLPPGLIDHREWTEENGHNNALRVNGLGAPRAFYTPVIREVGFPNVSYGEDYAVGLAICRRHRIGRVYEPLYLCRRWEGNSDAALSIEAQNRNNWYKDKIRTWEMEARIMINKLQGDKGTRPPRQLVN